jgi:hypothetical protein
MRSNVQFEFMPSGAGSKLCLGRFAIPDASAEESYERTLVCMAAPYLRVVTRSNTRVPLPGQHFLRRALIRRW